MSDDIRNNIHSRKQAKLKIIETKCGGEAAKGAKKLYQKADKEIKFGAKADKRKYIYSLATEAQSAANKCDQAAVYNITTRLCDKSSNRNVPIRNREGVVSSSDKEQEERWVEHIKGVLSKPSPTSQAVFHAKHRC